MAGHNNQIKTETELRGGSYYSECCVLNRFEPSNYFIVMKYQGTTAFENESECFGLGWIILDKAEKGERMYFHNR